VTLDQCQERIDRFVELGRALSSIGLDVRDRSCMSWAAIGGREVARRVQARSDWPIGRKLEQPGIHPVNLLRGRDSAPRPQRQLYPHCQVYPRLYRAAPLTFPARTPSRKGGPNGGCCC